MEHARDSCGKRSNESIHNCHWACDEVIEEIRHKVHQQCVLKCKEFDCDLEDDSDNFEEVMDEC